MIAPARRAAFGALLAVAAEQRDSAAALAHVQRSLTDPRDIALASEIVHGVLRWQAALDAALAPLVAPGLGRLDLEVLVALRMAAYQRLFLTRIPASAAVNDAVSLVRRAGRTSAAGLVNAVLRRLTPETARAAWPPRPSADAIARLDASLDAPASHQLHADLADARRSALDYLSTTLSHPEWLVARWLDRFGFDAAERWATFNNTAAPLTIRRVAWRLSPSELAERLAQENIATTPARYAPEALIVTDGQPLRSPLWSEGLVMLQDEASQLVAHLACEPGPHSWLDVCAAPGGKTAYVRGCVRQHTLMVACDLRPRRVELLRETLLRIEAERVAVVRADATVPLPFGPCFDVVLLDVPCSGLGTIRREPEIRWRRGADDLAALAAAQQQMITHAAACVRAGGRLLYATCSSEPEENEAVVEAFLAGASAFRRLPGAQHPWKANHLAGLLDDRGDLRTLPHRHGLEAFYAAVLCRD